MNQKQIKELRSPVNDHPPNITTFSTVLQVETDPDIYYEKTLAVRLCIQIPRFVQGKEGRNRAIVTVPPDYS